MTTDPKDWIAVAALPDLGAGSIKRLWDQGWTPEKLLRSDPSTWQRLNLKHKTLTALVDYQQEYLQSSANSLVGKRVALALQWCASHADAHILPITHPDYPELLREISDPPPVLFVRGDLTALNLPQIALVGSRNASGHGVRQAYEFSAYLAQHGFVINSGLALGIDAAAHRACVEHHKPTVAVCGTGLDKRYPARNAALAAEILEQGGAWVSELFPGVKPLAANFPRRNRIISGMSAGVFVIEAALQSGSLITARMASEQGREVFALPGSVNNPLSKGCHHLIKQGAQLVETADDIVQALGPLLGCLSEPSVATQAQIIDLSAEEQRVINQLGYEIEPIDLLCQKTGLSIAELSQLLVGLELKGVICQEPGGYQRL